MEQPNQKQPTREEFIKSLFVLEEKDNYLLGQEAIDKIVIGIEKGCEVISQTYGSGGSNAEIEHIYSPFHLTTNDGKQILDSIKLQDRYENVGLEILKEITSKIEKVSGNGRKTAVILAGSILKEGLKSKLKPNDLKESLMSCLDLILANLDSQSKKIGYEDVGKVAGIASENAELGKIFQEIYTQIGKDGVVEIDNSELPDTFYEITEGVRLRNCGFMFPYMANTDKGRSSVFNSPSVLVVKEKIANTHQLDDIFKQITKSGKSELVIFCNEIDMNVSQTLAQLHQGVMKADGTSFTFKTLVIKAPTLWKDWMFEDFAKITGAKIINPAEGTSLKTFSMSWLGTCERITTTKDETVITGIKDISDHIAVLQEKGDSDSLLRISWLKTKTAILKLGANSDTELSVLKGKASDARNSSYLALTDGVVAGGGIAYINAIASLPKTPGGKILTEVLKTPFKQIVENSGKHCDIELVGGNDGYNSKTCKIVNMFDEGILDATLVVKNSVIAALSVISTVLTTKTVILLKK